jgi:hypothetical protein
MNKTVFGSPLHICPTLRAGADVGAIRPASPLARRRNSLFGNLGARWSW